MKRKNRKNQKGNVSENGTDEESAEKEELHDAVEKVDTDETDDEEVDSGSGESSKKKQKSGKQKKGKSAKAKPEPEKKEEEEYEVEKVLDEKFIKNVRHYLIRWKGYESESDTWEPETTLNCKDAIEEFKKKPPPKKVRPRKSAASKIAAASDEDDGEKKFEVSSIREVHHRKDGTKEFLVSWKGFASKHDTWEPEENLDCPDLIEKFLQKVEKAKHFDHKELREKRQQTQRFTLDPQSGQRRMSRRNRHKERVQYHDAE